MMNVPILVHPRAEDLKRVEAAIVETNRLQNYFRLSAVKAPWLPNSGKRVSSHKLKRLIRQKYPDEPAIAVINNPFDDNFFSHEDRGWMAITVWDWEALYAPPSLKTYLIYEFAGGLLEFAADLSYEVAHELEHNPSIGCFYDLCQEKESITLGMVGGNLCGTCESALLAMGLPIPAFRAVEKLLAHVRAETIRRPTGIPSKVFIGHGHSAAWKVLEKLLVEELGLDVVEFNRDPAAGIATTD
jgi:hypothetical protein